MHYRRLGATGLQVSVVGLRTWQYSGEWGQTFTQGEGDALVGRAREEDVLPAAARQQCGVLAREPLATGYVSGRHRPGRVIAGHDDWRSAREREESDADLEWVARLNASEVSAGVPIARWAIAWCPQPPSVSAGTPGSRTIEQLQGNVAAAELDLVSDVHPLAVSR